MPVKTYTYDNNVVEGNENNTDILVTRRNTRPAVIPNEEISIRSGQSRSHRKPRELNTSKKIRRDIKTLNKGYILAPSAQISIIDPVSLEKEAAERAAAEAKAKKRSRVLAGDDAMTDSKVVKVKRPFPFFFVILMGIFTLALMYNITLFVKVDDYNSRLNDLNARLVTAREEETQLQLKLDAKFNLASISRIAQEEYGMVSADSLPKNYVSISGDDQIEIIENEGQNTAGSLLSAFGDMINELLE
ncbi:MAG: hypothetical protein E7665_02960 [Ruminococcaceae bacterium]|nr:hypothetical protein [Oscillospiraceae bacterium]